jgi:hypothetical protein
MEINKFQNIYRIDSTRANWDDYSNGAYFITVCTNNKNHYFGEINNGVMELSKIGIFIAENLKILKSVILMSQFLIML